MPDDEQFNWKDFVELTDIPCNCAWMHCPVHPETLCEGKTMALNCGEKGHSHMLGEGTLGPDAHICAPCAGALTKIFATDIPSFMRTLEPHIPGWLRSLNHLVSEAYSEKFNKGGWVLPQRDALAVFSLALLVFRWNNEEAIKEPTLYQRIPGELLDQLRELSLVVREISRSFALPNDMLQITKEEPAP